jgi:hypothetical protein
MEPPARWAACRGKSVITMPTATWTRSDFAALPDCLTGPHEGANFLPPSALCEQVFDFDGDGDVDTRDYAIAQTAATP